MSKHEADSKRASLPALVDEVAGATGLSRAKVREVLDTFGAAAARELCDGHWVRLPVLGSLRPRTRKPRQGVAPNGKAWEDEGGVRVALHVAQPLQDRLDRPV